MKNSINIDNPVFVMGTGRCGLSPLMELLSCHPAFAWPSQFNNKFPKYTFLSFLSRVVDFPIIGNPNLRNRYFPPRHSEAFNFYNRQFYGFAQPFRDLTSGDVTPYSKSKFRKAVYDIMKYQGKTHFMMEYSGWSRMGFLKEIFPGAKFIHIVRDGRAVANSLTNVHWWLGWEGVYQWRWGVPEDELMAMLEKYNHSFLALAAIHWKILIRQIIEHSQELPVEDVLVVRYEDMVQDPLVSAHHCIEFCGLDIEQPIFDERLRKVKIVNANENKFRIPAWQANMTQDHIDMLNDLLAEELIYFNYLGKSELFSGSSEDIIRLNEMASS